MYHGRKAGAAETAAGERVGCEYTFERNVATLAFFRLITKSRFCHALKFCRVACSSHRMGCSGSKEPERELKPPTQLDAFSAEAINARIAAKAAQAPAPVKAKAFKSRYDQLDTRLGGQKPKYEVDRKGSISNAGGTVRTSEAERVLSHLLRAKAAAAAATQTFSRHSRASRASRASRTSEASPDGQKRTSLLSAGVSQRISRFLHRESRASRAHEIGAESVSV